MVAAIILARYLDVTGYATYGYFQLTLATLSAYASMGTGVAATRLFALLTEETQRQECQLLAAMISISFTFSAIAALIVFALPPTASGGSKEPIFQLLLALAVFASGFNSVPSGAVLGLQMHRSLVVISLATGIILIMGSIVSVAIGSAIFAMALLALTATLQLLAGAWIVVRRIGAKRIVSGFPFHAKQIYQVMAFAGPMFLVTLLASAAPWAVGRLVLSSSQGNQNFAMYTIGLQWFALAILLPTQIAIVIMPRMVQANAQAAHPGSDMRRMIRNGLGLALAMSIAVVIIGLLFGELVIPIYGSNYELDSWFITAYLIAGCLGGMSLVIGNAIVGSNRPWQWLGLSGLWFAVLMFLSCAYQGLGGLLGAVAFAGAYLVLLVAALCFSWTKRLI